MRDPYNKGNHRDLYSASILNFKGALQLYREHLKNCVKIRRNVWSLFVKTTRFQMVEYSIV